MQSKSRKCLRLESSSEMTRRYQLTITFLQTLLLIALILAGCSGKEEKKTDLVTFPLNGVVVSVEPGKRTVMIAHEEIPDYMMAMTMPFKVKDTTLLANLHAGDSVQATLVVSRTESWLEGLHVIGKGETSQTLSAEEVQMVRYYKEGESIPDFSFTNQERKRIRLSDFRGKVLAMTFIYTRCPLPDFCIRMSDYFAKVQKLLTKEKSLQTKWHLLTISFDPSYDTPEVLKRYGKTYAADFSTWDFATDKMENIQTLADGLGLTVQGDQGGLIAHNLRTVLIDQHGKLAKVITGNEWTPDELVSEIRRLTGGPSVSPP